MDVASVPQAGTGVTGPRAWSTRQRLVAFVALAYVLSWSWWVPMALSGAVVGAGQGWPTHLPGLMGPAIAAIIVTALTRGRAGLAELWSRIIRWRVSWVWYAIIVGTAGLLIIPELTNPNASVGDFLTYSGAPSIGLTVFVYVLLVNGFGEEIGWRGYLADGLLAEHSRAVTALIVWVIWAGWHLPLFWIVASFREFGLAGTIGWVVGIGFGSVFLTWLYQSADRSILIVALWHTAYNFTTATEATAGAAASVASTVVIIVSAIILFLPGSWRRPAAAT